MTTPYGFRVTKKLSVPAPGFHALPDIFTRVAITVLAALTLALRITPAGSPIEKLTLTTSPMLHGT